MKHKFITSLLILGLLSSTSVLGLEPITDPLVIEEIEIELREMVDELDVEETELEDAEKEKTEDTVGPQTLTEDQLKEKFAPILEEILASRNEYVLNHDTDGLQTLYDIDVKVSQYAYEHEAIKAKYLDNWAKKQGVSFKNIESQIHLRKVRDRSNGLYGMTCNICTTFTYAYDTEPDIETSFRLGTSHYIHLQQKGDKYVIVKEWYTDPFSDSLELKAKEPAEITNYLTNAKAPSYTADERTQKAIDYAHTHCGIGDGEHMFKYNKEYMDCNPLGGDCANFASQIMFEGAGFKKNGTWNYTHEGTKAWVNAQGLTHYIINSGRGHKIAQGSYEKIYKTASQMRPGDIVAYEKKGRITHVSTVTGLDNHGYPLVTCHNTDRLLVPYDLGWSNSNITFHLVDVYY